jgi:hypothetical protein
MPDTISTPTPQVPSRQIPVAAMIAAGLVGLLLAVTVALWAHYGSAVFYEMLLTGIAACF